MEARPSATPDVTVGIEPDLDLAGHEFADLFARSSATAFQHPLWLSTFYERLAPARRADKLIVTIREHGRLVGLLPMIRRRLSGVLLVESADLGVSDYAAPVVDAGLTPDASLPERIVAALAPFDWLRIRPVRAEHLDSWRSLVGGEALRLDFSAHATPLTGSFPEWQAQALQPAFRRYLDRRKKRFFRGGAGALKLLEDGEDILAAIAAIGALRSGRFEGDPIQQDFTRSFYACIAAEGAAAGLSRIYALSHGGEAVGYVFGLTHAGRFHYLLIGCDYERHGRHSPGLLLYDAIIEDWMSAGGSIYDFTIGDEPFKRDFGTKPTAMFMLSSAPTWRGRLARAAYEIREQMRARRRKTEHPGESKPEGGTDGQ